MTQITTDLGNTRESARSWRVEPSGDLTETNVQLALEQIAADANAGMPASVIVTTASYNVTATDRVIYVNYAGVVSLNLPLAADHGTASVIVKDTSGAAATNNIWIIPNVADTGAVDGLDPLVIDSDYGSFEIRPDTLAWRVTG